MSTPTDQIFSDLVPPRGAPQSTSSSSDAFADLVPPSNRNAYAQALTTPASPAPTGAELARKAQAEETIKQALANEPASGLGDTLLGIGTAAYNALRSIPTGIVGAGAGLGDIAVNALARKFAPHSTLARVQPQDVESAVANFGKLTPGQLAAVFSTAGNPVAIPMAMATPRSGPNATAAESALENAGSTVFGAPGRGWQDIGELATKPIVQSSPEIAQAVTNALGAMGNTAAGFVGAKNVADLVTPRAMVEAPEVAAEANLNAPVPQPEAQATAAAVVPKAVLAPTQGAGAPILRAALDKAETDLAAHPTDLEAIDRVRALHEAMGTEAAQVSHEAPAEQFTNPHEERVAQFQAQSKELGLNDQQAAALTPKDVRDPVTGFFGPADRMPTLTRAQQFVERTGQPGVYVEADIQNLGGVNAALGHSGANERVYTPFARIFQKNLEATGGHVVPFKHGGDEMSAVVVGAKPGDVQAALERTEQDVRAYASKNDLTTIPHPKHPGMAGTGLYTGLKEIEPGIPVDNIPKQVDSYIEATKKEQFNVNRSTAPAAGALAPGEQAGGIEPGTRPAIEPDEDHAGGDEAPQETAPGARPEELTTPENTPRRYQPPRVDPSKDHRLAAIAKSGGIRPDDTVSGSSDIVNPAQTLSQAPQKAPITNTAKDARLRLQKEVGRSTIDRLEQSGLLKIHDRAHDIPIKGAPVSERAGVQGYWDGKTMHLAADSIENGHELGVLLHEAVHGSAKGSGSLKQILGNQFDDLDRTFQKLLDSGDEAAARAQLRVPKDTPPDLVKEERLAYLVEDVANADAKARATQFSGPVLDMARRVYNGLRAAFYKSPFYQAATKLGVKIDLTPRDLVAMARQSLSKLGGEDEPAIGTAHSEAPEYHGDVLLHGLRLLAKHDEAFQSPKAEGITDLAGVAKAIFPKLMVHEDPSLVQDNPHHPDRGWLIKTPAGTSVDVYQRGNEIWTDLSDMDPGARGSRIYQTIATWAHNAGLKYIGDPQGMSHFGAVRRTEMMLSSALKHDTTEHLVPHQIQLDGIPGYGVHPLKWREGDHDYNTRQLALTASANTHSEFPELGKVGYNHDTQRFEDEHGYDLRPEDFDRIAASGRQEAVAVRSQRRAFGGQPTAGRQSLRRAVFIRALGRAKGREGSQLLAALRELRSNDSLDKLFYSKAPEDQGPETQPVEEHIPDIGERFRRILSSHTPDPVKTVLNGIHGVVTPISAGDTETAAIAKDYANETRGALVKLNDRVTWLRKNFTPEQRTKIWEATSAENVARVRGDPSPTDGFASLTPEERNAAEMLQRENAPLAEQAVKLGILKHRFQIYDPRFLAEIAKEHGGSSVMNPLGHDLRLTTPHAISRKHVTAGETEEAAKALYGEQVHLIRDALVLPYAKYHLERIVAARHLMNGLRAYGDEHGVPTVISDADRDLPANKGQYVTIDNPAFRENGRQLHIHKNFEGPLRAILHGNHPNIVTRGLMSLKSKAMSAIVGAFPPVHRSVIFSKVVTAYPAAMFTGRLQALGRSIREADVGSDLEKTKQRYNRGGLADVSQRGGWAGTIEDMVKEKPIDEEVGKSWTAKMLSAPAKLAGKTVGKGDEWSHAVKSAVDALGELWHSKWMWEKVANTQYGLAAMVHRDLVAHGMSDEGALKVAMQVANRFVGSIPYEDMGQGTRTALNLSLFSRSFTMSNAALYKDAVGGGLPKAICGQLDEADQKIGANFYRKKAAAALVKDILMLNVINSAAQSTISYLRHQQTGNQIAQGYIRRLHAYAQAGEHNPLSYLELNRLSSTYDNEPGKQDYIYLGRNAQGTGLYLKNLFGKVGFDLQTMLTSPISFAKRKESTILSPFIATLQNDKGYGRQIYDPNADGLGGAADNVLAVAKYIIEQQVPSQQIGGAYNLVTGKDRSTENLAQTALTPMGLFVSHGAPGGPAAGMLYAQNDEQKFKEQQMMPQVYQLARSGHVKEAVEIMNQKLGMTAQQIRARLRFAIAPDRMVTERKLTEFMIKATPAQRAQMLRYLKGDQQSQETAGDQ